MLPTLGAS
jgi:hypothetical protein